MNKPATHVRLLFQAFAGLLTGLGIECVGRITFEMMESRFASTATIYTVTLPTAHVFPLFLHPKLSTDPIVHCREVQCKEVHCTEVHCTEVQCTEVQCTEVQCTEVKCRFRRGIIFHTILHVKSIGHKALHFSATMSKIRNTRVLFSVLRNYSHELGSKLNAA